MKKKIIKIFAVAVVTMMVLSMGILSVNAADIQPRGRYALVEGLCLRLSHILNG